MVHAICAWLAGGFGAYTAVQHGSYCAAPRPGALRRDDAALDPGEGWIKTMSAPLAKSDLVFKLATSQSYIDHSYDPAPSIAAQPAPRGLLRRIGDGLASLAQGVRDWTDRQATLSEMGMMSDRELADIGLSRGDVPRVFDADFLADHVKGRVVN
jgi:uncharacterized protein YjiS (DUF1127 family)